MGEDDDEVIKLNSANMESSAEKNSDDEEVYEVEKIVGMSKSKGKTLYRVRWLGYDSSWDTWEPAENLDTCDDLIEKYLEAQKKTRKKPGKASTSSASSAAPPSGSVAKETETHGDSSDSERSKQSESSEKKRKAAKGASWAVVDSSDEEFETLKDTFWRDLEQGKVNVFKTDMYSNIKGPGVRSSRPQSFKDMYKNQKLVASTEEPVNKKEKRKSGITKSNSQEKLLPSSAEKPKLKLTDTDKPKTVTVKSPTDEEKFVTGQKGSKARPSSAEKTKKKPKTATKGKDTKRTAIDKLPKLVLKTVSDGALVQKQQTPESASTSKNEGGRDTFWDDLKEGKIDVFQSDMYSKVKGSGARSSRPQSFKEMYQNKPLVQSNNADRSPTKEKKKETNESKPKVQDTKKRSPGSASKTNVSSPNKKETPPAKGSSSTTNIESSSASKKLSDSEESESAGKMMKKKPRPGTGGKFKSMKQKEKTSVDTPNDSKPATPVSVVPAATEEKATDHVSKIVDVDRESDCSGVKDVSKLPSNVLEKESNAVKKSSKLDEKSPDMEAEVPRKRVGRSSVVLSDGTRLNECYVRLERLPASLIALRTLNLAKFSLHTKPSSKCLGSILRTVRKNDSQQISRSRKDSSSSKKNNNYGKGSCKKTQYQIMRCFTKEALLGTGKKRGQKKPENQISLNKSENQNGQQKFKNWNGQKKCEKQNGQKKSENRNGQKTFKIQYRQKNSENWNGQKKSENQNGQIKSENQNGQKKSENKNGYKMSEHRNGQKNSENRNSQKMSKNRNSQKMSENRNGHLHKSGFTPPSIIPSHKLISSHGKVCSIVSDVQNNQGSGRGDPRSYPGSARKKTDSESSTEVPTKRKRKSESECSTDVPQKKANLEFEEFNLDTFQDTCSPGDSKLEIEDFTLEGFDSSEKTPAKDTCGIGSTTSEHTRRPCRLNMDSSGSQDSGVNMDHINTDLEKPLTDDHIFDNSPVAGNDKDIDLLRRISEGTAAENNNQVEKDLDLIDFDISELDIPPSQLLKLQSCQTQAGSPQTLNQVEFRRAVKSNEFEKVYQALKHSKKTYDLEQADPDGVTLAMICAIRGYDDMLELLGRYGANINAETKNGTTALMMACEKNRICTVTQLLHMGAYLNKETTTTCETALLKSVKRGFTKVASTLLDFGCNYNSPTREDLCASKFAKNYQQRELLRLLNDHRDRVTAEFESQVNITLNQTATIKQALFPIQCLALNESDKFKVYFKHELEPTKAGVGMLLFIAHARVNLSEVKCRFYGPCAVNSVLLNDAKLHPLTEEGNFVMSFGPLLNGKNELEISTARAPTSKAKLLVCAYTAQLT